MIRASGCLLLIAAFLFLLRTDPASAEPALQPPEKIAKPPAASTDKMPLSGLTVAKPMFDACIYKYGVGTTNAQCQAFVNQGLGMYYSYVWIEAVRAFETALQHDPDCAYAWLMLHRSLEKWGRSGAVTPANPFVAVAGGAIYGKLPTRL